MADALLTIFKNKKVNPLKITQGGFKNVDGGFEKKTNLNVGGLVMTVRVSDAGKIFAKVEDPSVGEPYTCHLVDGMTGSFVGEVKARYEEVLREIADTCCDSNVFKSEQAHALIVYIRDRYGDELEFLWKKTPNNAVWRRKDTGKWYCAVLTVARKKLGFDDDGDVEVIDLRIRPADLDKQVNEKTLFRGYHMNKKSWCTILLNNSMSFAEICRRVDESYLLAVK